MVSYTKEILSSVQKAVNKGQFEMTNYKSYEEIGIINVNDVILHPCETMGRRDCMLISNDTDFNDKEFNKWKETAGGHFYVKDYKKEIKDNNGLVPYYVLNYMYDNIQFRVLVRHLFECYDEEIPEETRKTLQETYGNLSIDSKVYAIIKITDTNLGTSWASRDNLQHILNDYENTKFESQSYIELEEEEPTLDGLADKLVSEPLF